MSGRGEQLALNSGPPCVPEPSVLEEGWGKGEGSAATGDLELKSGVVPACRAQTPGASAAPQRSRAFIEVPAQARDARALLAHPHLHLHPVLARGP